MSAVEIRFFPHPATNAPMITAGLFASLTGFDGDVLTVLVSSFVEVGFSKRYAREFVMLAEAGDLCMTLDGVVALGGHVEPSVPGALRRLEGIRQAMQHAGGSVPAGKVV